MAISWMYSWVTKLFRSKKVYQDGKEEIVREQVFTPLEEIRNTIIEELHLPPVSNEEVSWKDTVGSVSKYNILGKKIIGEERIYQINYYDEENKLSIEFEGDAYFRHIMIKIKEIARMLDIPAGLNPPEEGVFIKFLDNGSLFVVEICKQ